MKNNLMIAILVAQFCSLLYLWVCCRMVVKSRAIGLEDTRRMTKMAALRLSVFPSETDGNWGVILNGSLVCQDPDLRVALDTAIVELTRIQAGK